MCFSSFNNANTNPKRGVTILVRSNLNPSLIFRCVEGNLIKIQCNFKGTSFDVIGLYGPNTDDPNFFKSKLLPCITHRPTIIAGDFNIKLKLYRDTSSTADNSHPRATKILSSIISSFRFKDVACEANDLQHTFFSTDKNHRPVSSRIDLFLIKGFLQEAIKKYNVIDSKLSDHKAIHMDLDPLEKEVRNKKQWILNSRLLKEPEINKKIESIIQEASHNLRAEQDIFLLVEYMLARIKTFCRGEGAKIAFNRKKQINKIESISR
ncbi:Uncharacterized protein FKW44_015236, partial [Caligus rogercresseyi]